MKIAIGSDHAGFTLKEAVKQHLTEVLHHEVIDVGTDSKDISVDYPEFAYKVAVKVANSEVDKGLLFCGTGIGMSIAANKVKGIRAANVWDVSTAMLAAKHNKANILTLGGRLFAPERAFEIIEAFLSTPFEERHQKRLDLINEIESGTYPEDTK